MPQQRSMTKCFAVCVLLAACTTGSSTGITSESLTCDPSLTYANFGSDFFTTNCLSCHATKERPQLTTQSAIQTNKAAILQQAVYTTAMPQDADLTTDERKLLGAWLACGAP